MTKTEIEAARKACHAELAEAPGYAPNGAIHHGIDIAFNWLLRHAVEAPLLSGSMTAKEELEKRFGFKVATFCDGAGKPVRCYTRYYNSAWEGCVVFDVEATSGTEAKTGFGLIRLHRKPNVRAVKK